MAKFKNLSNLTLLFFLSIAHAGPKESDPVKSKFSSENKLEKEKRKKEKEKQKKENKIKNQKEIIQIIESFMKEYGTVFPFNNEKDYIEFLIPDLSTRLENFLKDLLKKELEKDLEEEENDVKKQAIVSQMDCGFLEFDNILKKIDFNPLQFQILDQKGFEKLIIEFRFEDNSFSDAEKIKEAESEKKLKKEFEEIFSAILKSNIFREKKQNIKDFLKNISKREDDDDTWKLIKNDLNQNGFGIEIRKLLEELDFFIPNKGQDLKKLRILFFAPTKGYGQPSKELRGDLEKNNNNSKYKEKYFEFYKKDFKENKSYKLPFKRCFEDMSFEDMCSYDLEPSVIQIPKNKAKEDLEITYQALDQAYKTYCLEYSKNAGQYQKNSDGYQKKLETSLRNVINEHNSKNILTSFLLDFDENQRIFNITYFSQGSEDIGFLESFSVIPTQQSQAAQKMQNQQLEASLAWDVSIKNALKDIFKVEGIYKIKINKDTLQDWIKKLDEKIGCYYRLYDDLLSIISLNNSDSVVIPYGQSQNLQEAVISFSGFKEDRKDEQDLSKSIFASVYDSYWKTENKENFEKKDHIKSLENKLLETFKQNQLDFLNIRFNYDSESFILSDSEDRSFICSYDLYPPDNPITKEFKKLLKEMWELLDKKETRENNLNNIAELIKSPEFSFEKSESFFSFEKNGKQGKISFSDLFSEILKDKIEFIFSNLENKKNSLLEKEETINILEKNNFDVTIDNSYFEISDRYTKGTVKMSQDKINSFFKRNQELFTDSNQPDPEDERIQNDLQKQLAAEKEKKEMAAKILNQISSEDRKGIIDIPNKILSSIEEKHNNNYTLQEKGRLVIENALYLLQTRSGFKDAQDYLLENGYLNTLSMDEKSLVLLRKDFREGCRIQISESKHTNLSLDIDEGKKVDEIINEINKKEEEEGENEYNLMYSQETKEIFDNRIKEKIGDKKLKTLENLFSNFLNKNYQISFENLMVVDSLKITSLDNKSLTENLNFNEFWSQNNQMEIEFYGNIDVLNKKINNIVSEIFEKNKGKEFSLSSSLIDVLEKVLNNYYVSFNNENFLNILSIKNKKHENKSYDLLIDKYTFERISSKVKNLKDNH